MKRLSFINLSLLTVGLFLITSCNMCNKDKSEIKQLKVDVSDVKIEDIKIHRYEEALFKVNPDNIVEGIKPLIKEYGFFLGYNANKTKQEIIQLRSYLTDSLILNLYQECLKKYPNVNYIEVDLTKSLQYCKYYYPEINIPKVYTYVSGLDYEYPIKYADSILIVALDMYLGCDYKYYKRLGIPLYKTLTMRKEYIVRDCMKEIALTKTEFDNVNNTLLNEMIFQGKILYFIDAMMPDISDSIKINYTSKQIDWAQKNESNVWAYMIEKKLLYSSDKLLINKFVGEAPFTSAFSKKSSPRLACWLGWQIVRNYMKNNQKIGLKELLKEKNAQKILSSSRYKPKTN